MASKNPKLDLVKLTSGVKKGLKVQQAINDIDKKIQELGNLSHLEHDPSIVLHLMNLVENLKLKTQTGKEKRDLVIQKLVQLFPTSNNEKDIKRYENLCDWICEMNLITKVTDVAVVSSSFCSYLLKKVV